MTWSGQCMDCANARVTENIIGLHLHQGEPLRRWRRGMVESAGGIWPDE